MSVHSSVVPKGKLVTEIKTGRESFCDERPILLNSSRFVMTELTIVTCCGTYVWTPFLHRGSMWAGADVAPAALVRILGFSGAGHGEGASGHYWSSPRAYLIKNYICWNDWCIFFLFDLLLPSLLLSCKYRNRLKLSLQSLWEGCVIWGLRNNSQNSKWKTYPGLKDKLKLKLKCHWNSISAHLFQFSFSKENIFAGSLPVYARFTYIECEDTSWWTQWTTCICFYDSC